MRLGIVSDTHGSRAAIERCIAAAGDVDAWLHCGDFAADADHLPGALAVRGNCDGGSSTPAERVVEFGGVRIFMCHGHLFDVNVDAYRVALRAEELGCRLALYGHTHVPAVSAHGGIVILNPGSPQRPLGGSRPSMGIVVIEDSDIKSSRIVLV